MTCGHRARAPLGSVSRKPRFFEPHGAASKGLSASCLVTTAAASVVECGCEAGDTDFRRRKSMHRSTVVRPNVSSAWSRRAILAHRSACAGSRLAGSGRVGSAHAGRALALRPRQVAPSPGWRSARRAPAPPRTRRARSPRSPIERCNLQRTCSGHRAPPMRGRRARRRSLKKEPSDFSMTFPSNTITRVTVNLK